MSFQITNNSSQVSYISLAHNIAQVPTTKPDKPSYFRKQDLDVLLMHLKILIETGGIELIIPKKGISITGLLINKKSEKISIPENFKISDIQSNQAFVGWLRNIHDPNTVSIYIMRKNQK